jgi:hypothetical protein
LIKPVYGRIRRRGSRFFPHKPRARVDAALEVASARQTVAVVEQAPMIQTDSAIIGGAVTSQQLAELQRARLTGIRFTGPAS